MAEPAKIEKERFADFVAYIKAHEREQQQRQDSRSNRRKGSSMSLDTDIQEFYEERAAILQYDAGYPKEKAEALAMAEAETWQKERHGE